MMHLFTILFRFFQIPILFIAIILTGPNPVAGAVLQFSILPTHLVVHFFQRDGLVTFTQVLFSNPNSPVPGAMVICFAFWCTFSFVHATALQQILNRTQSPASRR
ncbi:MAG: hypothetical protein MI717_04215 [Spirochaetales bacterium]|nr:hypothetical protein [Spirochaetales bacterium]